MKNDGILRFVTFTLATQLVLYLTIGPIVGAEDGRRVERSDLAGNKLWLGSYCSLDMAKGECLVWSHPILTHRIFPVMNPRFRSHAQRKQEVMLGDRLKLRCAAVSKPRPYVHWYRNNELLSKTQTKPRIKISQYSLTIMRVSVRRRTAQGRILVLHREKLWTCATAGLSGRCD